MTCEVSDNCFNAGTKCWYCKFSKTCGEGGTDNNYAPIDKKITHPDIIKAKEEKKRLAWEEKKTKTIDKKRSELVKKAAKVENKVYKTLNSGRVNRDGDLKTKDLAIDVKYQSTRINPEINMDEFRKIQNDAVRAGKNHGVLAIVNKEQTTLYVISEQLFKEVFV